MELTNYTRELPRLVEQPSAQDAIYDGFRDTDQPPPSDQDEARPAPKVDVRFSTRDIALTVVPVVVSAAALLAWVVADPGRTRRAVTLIKTVRPPRALAGE